MHCKYLLSPPILIVICKILITDSSDTNMCDNDPCYTDMHRVLNNNNADTAL